MPRFSLSLLNKVEVGPSSFQKIKLLGRGDVGKVFLVREKKNGKLYAMKGTYLLLKRAILIHNVVDSFIQEGDDSTEKDQARVDRTGDTSNCQSPIHSDPSPFISVGGLSIPLHGVLHGG
jgi:serine/threonine protein kinase